jgi:hypothetical protein
MNCLPDLVSNGFSAAAIARERMASVGAHIPLAGARRLRRFPDFGRSAADNAPIIFV